MKTQIVGGLAIGLMAAGLAASAQDAIVGEKGVVGEKGIVGEKGVIGEKRGAQDRRGQTSAVLPANISRLLQQPPMTVRYRPAAIKLKQLPPEALAAQPQASDLGTPFRLEPSQTPGAGRQWYASHATSITSAMQQIELAHDPGARANGRFGLVFPVQAGYRYLVDCAVAHASEFELSHTGFGQAAEGARTAANSGLVSFVSAPVRDGGRGWIEFKAVRTQSGAWQWRGCEITPLRAQ